MGITLVYTGYQPRANTRPPWDDVAANAITTRCGRREFFSISAAPSDKVVGEKSSAAAERNHGVEAIYLVRQLSSSHPRFQSGPSSPDGRGHLHTVR